MMIFIIIIFILLVIVGLVVLFVSNTVIKLNTIVIEDNKIDKDIDVVFISDLHVGMNNKKKSLKKIIDLVNTMDGDYLFVGGDMVGYKPLKYYKEKELIELLDAFKIKNRYFVEGNHDDFEYPLYNNFRILNDEIVKLSENIILLGLKWEKDECLDYKLDSDNFNVLLSHYPDRVEEYSKIDLALGAHSHGNQINLPFCKFHHKEKYTRGMYNIKERTKLYVNKGLGFSLLKIRVFSCREIVKIELRRGGSNGNS